jgi:hypothetical protein
MTDYSASQYPRESELRARAERAEAECARLAVARKTALDELSVVRDQLDAALAQKEK